MNSRLDQVPDPDAAFAHVRRSRRIPHARRVVRPRGGMAFVAGG